MGGTCLLDDEKYFDRLACRLREFTASEDTETFFYLAGDEYKNEKAYAGIGSFFKKYRFSLKKVGKNLLITPLPVVHNVHEGVSGRAQTSDNFENLKLILENGFISNNFEGNAVYKKDKNHRFNEMYTQWAIKAADKPYNEKKDPITTGDVYALEMLPEDGFDHGRRTDDFALHKASPNRISSVNIILYKNATEETRENKMEYYQKEITEKYHVPVRFYIQTEETGDPDKMKRVFPQT